jgi:hypothetical protein
MIFVIAGPSFVKTRLLYNLNVQCSSRVIELFEMTNAKIYVLLEFFMISERKKYLRVVAPHFETGITCNRKANERKILQA